jgi:hypothetical protein
MTAASRRVWDGYVGQLAGPLRGVDGFALMRLCEDVAELQDLQVGRRKLLAQMKAAAKAEGRLLPGGAAVALEESVEGQRLKRSISQLSARIYRAELQFGLTPLSATRLEGGDYHGGPALAEAEDPLEKRLCG